MLRRSALISLLGRTANEFEDGTEKEITRERAAAAARQAAEAGDSKGAVAALERVAAMLTQPRRPLPSRLESNPLSNTSIVGTSDSTEPDGGGRGPDRDPTLAPGGFKKLKLS